MVLGTAPLLWGQAAPPVLSTLNPMGVLAGGPVFTLTATGSGFTGGLAGSGLRWNGQTIPTTIVSDTQAVGTVPAANIATAGYAQVRFDRVGATATQSSNSIMFYIYYPITSISPQLYAARI